MNTSKLATDNILLEFVAREKSIEVVEHMLSDIKSSLSVQTVIILRRCSDGEIEQFVCGKAQEAVSMLHSSMCHDETFKEIVNQAVLDHEICEAMRNGFTHDDRAPF